MDGENNGSKPYEQMDDLGGFFHPYFWFNTHWEKEILWWLLVAVKDETWNWSRRPNLEFLGCTGVPRIELQRQWKLDGESKVLHIWSDYPLAKRSSCPRAVFCAYSCTVYIHHFWCAWRALFLWLEVWVLKRDSFDWLIDWLISSLLMDLETSAVNVCRHKGFHNCNPTRHLQVPY